MRGLSYRLSARLESPFDPIPSRIVTLRCAEISLELYRLDKGNMPRDCHWLTKRAKMPSPSGHRSRKTIPTADCFGESSHDMTSAILFGQLEKDHVLIELLPEALPAARTASVTVNCGVWKGRYAMRFVPGELGRFGREIEYFRESLRLTATLNCAEHCLRMTLSEADFGRIVVEGRASEHLGDHTALTFKFDIDRESLPALARSLIAVDF